MSNARISKETFDGPFGMTAVDLFDDLNDVVAAPLSASVSLSISTRGASNPHRIVQVQDALGQAVADAYLPREVDKDAQAQAAQWLLDLCCTRLGVEGIEVKSSPFNVVYR